MRRIASVGAVLTAGAFLAITPGLVLASARSAPHTCSGTLSKPGVLKAGRYDSGVTVKGVCEVNDGVAHVVGPLQLGSGSTMIAAFGMHKSKLTVDGNVTVDKGATFVLGCNTTSFACVDDPNQSHPTLSSPGLISGNVTETSPLGVIIHSTKLGGGITETGGGGGVNCTVPKTGPFSLFQSPVYSDYEDDTITGNLTITKVNSCWLGIARVHVNTLKVTYDSMADPDAIEILSNKVGHNLACIHDKPHVWDSAEIPQNGAIYPRKLERNTVAGKRSGQCVKAGPLTSGGPDAGGAF
jgi:hypothetical protein